MRRTDRIALVLPVIFFLSVFLLYTRPLAMGDFWWHLNTGRWIVEHGDLPEEDPFAYTTPREHDPRREMILKGFWLSQSLFYIVYEAAGLEGLILLRAGLFALTFLVLYRILRGRGVDRLAALVLVAAAAALGRFYEETRPHVFSFLFTLLLFSSLEGGLAELRRGARPWRLMAAPLLMLLWSNLHRGYFIGHAVFGVYAAAEALRLLLGRSDVTRSAYGRFLAWGVLAMLVAGVNPNAFSAFTIGLREVADNPFVIDEYKPPWAYAAFKGIPVFWYGLLAFSAGTLGVVAAARRRLALRHVLLAAGFAGAAFISFRFGIFFILMGTAIAGGYLGGVVVFQKRFVRGTLLALVLVVCATFLVLFGRESFLTRRTLYDGPLPVAAVNFSRSYELPPRVFTPYEWGGYVGWRIYPQGVFVDARTLDVWAQQVYERVMAGETQFLDAYGVNTVITYPLRLAWESNPLPGLTMALLADAQWRLVYVDSLSAVFVRGAGAPRLPVIGKEFLVEEAAKKLSVWMENAPTDVRIPMAMGELWTSVGERKKARMSFQRVLDISPGHAAARRGIERLEGSTRR